jgi:hypothetical protein
MHVRIAEDIRDPTERLSHLRSARDWAERAGRRGKALFVEIAEKMEAWGRASGVVTAAEREVLSEAAALYSRGGAHDRAGALWELLGEPLHAAEAYQKAGEIERLERVLSREEVARRRTQRSTDAFEEYRLHMMASRRRAALEALTICLEVPGDARYAEWRRLADDLRARGRSGGVVTVSGGGINVTYVGQFPIVFGRDAECTIALRDGGISRRHAELAPAGGGGGRFTVRDLESRNGTRLAGVRIDTGAPVELPDECELGLGDGCVLRVSTVDGTLELTIKEGLDRGRMIQASPAAFDLAGGAKLSFDHGTPVLARGETPLYVNDVNVAERAELIAHDRFTIGDRTYEVG